MINMNILLTMFIVHAQTNLFDSRASKEATEDDLSETMTFDILFRFMKCIFRL
jgi:hypothetical protein